MTNQILLGFLFISVVSCVDFTLNPLFSTNKCFIYTYYNDIFIPYEYEVPLNVQSFKFTIRSFSFEYTETLNKFIENGNVYYGGKNIKINKNFTGTFGNYSLFDHYISFKNNESCVCTIESVNQNIEGNVLEIFSVMYNIHYVMSSNLTNLNIDLITNVSAALMSRDNVLVRRINTTVIQDLNSYNKNDVNQIISKLNNEDQYFSKNKVYVFLINYENNLKNAFTKVNSIFSEDNENYIVIFAKNFNNEYYIGKILIHEIYHSLGVYHNNARCKCLDPYNICLMDDIYNSYSLENSFTSNCTYKIMLRYVHNRYAHKSTIWHDRPYYRLNNYIKKNIAYRIPGNVYVKLFYSQFKTWIPLQHIIDVIENKENVIEDV